MRNAEKSFMNRMLVWFIALSLLFGSLAALLSGALRISNSVHADVPVDRYRDHMEQLIPCLMEQYGIPGCSIAIVNDYGISWTQSFGFADVSSGRVLTPSIPMSVQSISKSITAWGVMKLVEKGWVDLDTPVSGYLKSWQIPWSSFQAEKITVRRLLSHTAGMPRGDFTDIYDPGVEMPSLREKLTREAIILREPGSGFLYSNVGYHLLELLIEEVSGQSYAEYIRSEVLLPLGMNSAVYAPESGMDQYPPTGYNLAGEPVPVYVYPEKASGGLFATAGDIARFVVACMTDNMVLNPKYVELMHTPESREIGIYSLVFDAYGLGCYLETLPNGLRSVSHGGQGKGIMTHFQSIPDMGAAIVVLTNSQRSWPFIANLLSDWARWQSIPSVGMGRIVWGQYGLSAVIGMLLSASVLIVLRLFQKVKKDRQPGLVWLKAGIAMILLGTVIWCKNQSYLMISSVFPLLSQWLGGAMVVLSAALLVSVLLPVLTGKGDRFL